MWNYILHLDLKMKQDMKLKREIVKETYSCQKNKKIFIYMTIL
jgi:hypothetical protein